MLTDWQTDRHTHDHAGIRSFLADDLKRKLHWLYVHMYFETWKCMFLRRSLASLARAYISYNVFLLSGGTFGGLVPPPPPPPISKSWLRYNCIRHSSRKLLVAFHAVGLEVVGWSDMLLRWYLRQQRVRVRVMIVFLVRGRVGVKISIRVRVGVTFSVSVYHWSNCRRSKCRTFKLRDW